MRVPSAALLLVALASCGNEEGPIWGGGLGKSEGAGDWTMTIAHINDSHGQVEELHTKIKLGGFLFNDTLKVPVGGYPRLIAKVNALRSSTDSLVVLHAGDAFRGSLYFNKFRGLAQLHFLELMNIDAMVVGNHEFDLGPEAVAAFAEQATFPVLGANVSAGWLAPYVIKQLDGRRVAIIGLTTDDTDEVSDPGQLSFEDPVTRARQIVAEVRKAGIDRIIVISHLGYGEDIELARQVAGIDAIVGGHSHAWLGDFSSVGKIADGRYPTMARDPNGNRVCIVQAAERTQLLGMLEVSFNAAGNVSSCGGRAVMLAGDRFERPTADGWSEIGADEKADVLQRIAENPAIEHVVPDAAAQADLDGKFKPQIEAVLSEPVGQPLNCDLSRERVAPIVAKALLWKIQTTGQTPHASIGLVNGGGVRGAINAGQLTGGDAYELLPFGNTLVVVDVPGTQLRLDLEKTVARERSGERRGVYLAGELEGRQIMGNASTALQWIRSEATYSIVTFSYLAEGKDGFDGLGAAQSRWDSGLLDVDVFMEFARANDICEM